MAYPTNPIYKIAKDDMVYADPSDAQDGVRLTKDGVEYFIPEDNQNKDWQEYLSWVADGNTAEPDE